MIATFLQGGTDGQIRGRITNMQGESMTACQVFVEDLGIGTVADMDGNYILLNVPVGTYDVTFAMIGYRIQIYSDIEVIMDNTVWLNVNMEVEAIGGDIIYVTGEKALVEKGSTSKKVTVSQEAIESLPIRDVSELYSLQAGVVKVDAGMRGGIPDHEERGLEEVHVRGGRSGEIAYLIDGMYIRNPIYGGIGSGTRLNLFAVKEFDWQPGGFNAEYGDAMSAVSNMHTAIGGDDFSYKYKYESSLVGALLGSPYDSLRGYHDYNLGFGGRVPLVKNLNYWFSGQYTSYENMRVYEFDTLYYREDDPNHLNKQNMVQPWDDKPGFIGFGFDKTWDVLGKLAYRLTDQIRLELSYWSVSSHRKGFNPRYLYWDEGQNELFRDSERIAFTLNHSLSSKTFYTIRYAYFQQDAFQGVRWQDSDKDGYPDWFEWNHGAGERSNYEGNKNLSDPYNPYVVPYASFGDSVFYNRRDGNGPYDWTSGWHFVDNNNDGINDAVPGNYNWNTAEEFTDINRNGVYDQGIDAFDINDDDNGDGEYTGPQLLEECEYRDGSYWLTPEMYVNYEDFYDDEGWWQRVLQDPYVAYQQHGTNVGSAFQDQYIASDTEAFYFLPSISAWEEGRVFGGSDRLYENSSAVTNELRFDITSQITDQWRARIGVDIKSHKLNFNQITNPWEDQGAVRQRFAEQWDDYGVDAIEARFHRLGNSDTGEGNGKWDGPMHLGTNDDIWQWGEDFTDCGNVGGETVCELLTNNGSPTDAYTNVLGTAFIGNGQWDEEEVFVDTGVSYPGEKFDDFNDNNSWDDYVEPIEVAAYFQNAFEVPWMVINAGIRIDAVKYNSKVWADPYGNYSVFNPWVWEDCGQDHLCAGHNDDASDIDGDLLHDDDIGENDGVWNYDEVVSSNYDDAENPKIFFKYADWQYKISPRIGVSHVITDEATFTFNYGVYHQTPIYEHIYLNTNRQEDPIELIQESDGNVGNATMVSQRTQSYEFAFNVQVGRNWAYSIGAWVKDMDQLSSAKTVRSQFGEYSVAVNADYGSARGIDLTLENRGQLINTTIQYTYSKAKGNSEYDKAAFDGQYVDAPTQEFIMPFDRPHDLTVSLYSSKLPWGINLGLNGFYQSGIPYTGVIFEGDDPANPHKLDELNKYSKRMEAHKQIDLSISKDLVWRDMSVSLGMNIFNVFDTKNIIDIYEETGSPEKRSEYYMKEIGLPEDGKTISNSFYDRPWMYGSPREINFFIRVDYR